MKIYTKTGDDGTTDLIGERRLKNDIRVESYGTIDELNSFVQLAISKMPESMNEIKDEFIEISHLLFDCTGDLANVKATVFKLKEEPINWLENRIDFYKMQVEDLKYFILPGGCELSAIVHICRTITRRAERNLVTLKSHEKINNNIMKFINRLSDYFFIVARICNKENGVLDSVYKRSKKVFKSE